MKTSKKIFALVLSLCMIFTMIPVFAETTDEYEPSDGVCPASETGEHVFDRNVAIVDRRASCTYTGIVHYQCSECKAFLSAVETPMDPNVHEVVGVEAAEPTCEEVGYTAGTQCSLCGEYISGHEEIPALGHDFIPDPDAYSEEFINPNFPCYKLAHYQCSRCDAAKVETLVENLEDHDFESEGGVAPTCDTDGVCAVCGQTIPAFGHSFSDAIPAVEATCTSDGNVEYYECEVCEKLFVKEDNEYVEVEEEDVIIPGGHTVVEIEIPASCTQVNGIYTYCSVCCEENEDGLGFTAAEDAAVDPANHTFYYLVEDEEAMEEDPDVYALKLVESEVDCEVVDVEAQDPTCTLDGCTEGTVCTLCNNAIVESEIIPALGHNAAVVTIPATCVTYDATLTYCTRCGEVEDEEGFGYVADEEAGYDYTNHSAYTLEESEDEEGNYVLTLVEREGDFIVVTKEGKDATCTENGLTDEKACSLCGKVVAAQTEIPAAHSWVPATCEEDGYCFVCTEKNPDDPALGHDWDEGEVIEAATCEAEGTMHFVCLREGCGAEKDEAIEALGHDYQLVEAVEPTCTEDGTVEYYVCGNEGCDKIFVLEDGEYVEVLDEDELVVPALDHDIVIDEAVAPTCTEDGLTEGCHCTRCDYVEYQDIVEKLGHAINTNGDPIDVVEATCEEQGYKLFKCARCEETYQIYTPALGHTAAEAVVENEVAPTCEGEGSYDSVVYCEVCDKELSRETITVDPTGHTAEEAVEENRVEATCKVPGSYDMVVYCAVCGEAIETNSFVIPALGHVEAEAVIENEVASTCTVAGSYDEVVYCEVCDEELSRTPVELELAEHTPAEAVKENEVESTCTVAGSFDKVVYCEVCDEELSRETVELPLANHTPEAIPAVEATYDTTGLTEGSKCAVCGEIIDEQKVTPKLGEEVEFTYEVTGTNSSSQAVNSGEVVVTVYANVKSDIARIYGLGFALAFDDTVTLTSVDGCMLEKTTYTALDKANAENLIKIEEDCGYETEGKTITAGKYTYATLIFKVDKDFYYNDVNFTVDTDSCDVSRIQDNVLSIDFGSGASIHIDMLGDADSNGKLTSNDILEFMLFYLNAEEEAYNIVLDMNKDGIIDGDDYVLLQNAVVGNNEYLDI